MANIFRLIDITGDPLYIKGFNEGFEKGFKEGFLKGEFRHQYEAVKSIILKTDFDNAQIAYMLSIPVEYVAIVRKEVTTAKKSA